MKLAQVAYVQGNRDALRKFAADFKPVPPPKAEQPSTANVPTQPKPVGSVMGSVMAQNAGSAGGTRANVASPAQPSAAPGMNTGPTTVTSTGQAPPTATSATAGVPGAVAVAAGAAQRGQGDVITNQGSGA